jgi:hypothetical protein
MNVKSCQFVEATEVFKDCMKAWDIFCESNPDCSWGDNNRTMVSRDVIVNAIESFFDAEDDCKYFIDFYTSRLESDPKSANAHVKKVFERLNNLSEDTYIDLEN